MNRRERFRKYMARLSPSAPWGMLDESLYVPRPDAQLSDQIARRLEIDPVSTHLLVGGIGSGKTTQLLMVKHQLQTTPDVIAMYIDVAERQDLNELKPGVLVALVGLALIDLLSAPQPEVQQAAERFKSWALGSVTWVTVPGRPPYLQPFDPYLGAPERRRVEKKGVLTPSKGPLKQELQDRMADIAVLRQSIAPHDHYLVVLFDSLDRLNTSGPFLQLLQEDVRALRASNIGSVLVGPLMILFGPDRQATDAFGALHHLPSVDIDSDVGRRFLKDVLARRSTPDSLAADALDGLVDVSGGVIRDLLSITRNAFEQAYISGADRVELVHVTRAAETFGRTLILGLGNEELATLRRVVDTREFVPTSDKDMALLLNRRILEYVDGTNRYAVHPSLKPLLVK